MAKRNPQTTVDDSVRMSKESMLLGIGYVDSVSPHETGDSNKHIVTIQPAGKNTTMTAQVSVGVEGDIHAPVSDGENIPVLYARRKGDVPVIIGLLYDSQSEVPEYEPGERRIGHALTDANIFFDEDGTVTVESSGGATVELQDDGTVVINGGTKGAVHDVSTTTDADGHVTSVSVDRRGDILI